MTPEQIKNHIGEVWINHDSTEQWRVDFVGRRYLIATNVLTGMEAHFTFKEFLEPGVLPQSLRKAKPRQTAMRWKLSKVLGRIEMVSESALKTVVAFNALPSSPEKDEISRKYLADEISNYDFFVEAKRYLDKVAERKAQEQPK